MINGRNNYCNCSIASQKNYNTKMRKLTVYKQTVIRLIEVERERENSKQLHFQIKLQPIDQTVGK